MLVSKVAHFKNISKTITIFCRQQQLFSKWVKASM